MKQKRLKDKKRNTLTTRNRRTAPSATYKPIKPVTKDYQKNNYDNQKSYMLLQHIYKHNRGIY